MIFMCPYCKSTYKNYREAEECELRCKEKIDAVERKKKEETDYWDNIRKEIKALVQKISYGNMKYHTYYRLSTYPYIDLSMLPNKDIFS